MPIKVDPLTDVVATSTGDPAGYVWILSESLKKFLEFREPNDVQTQKIYDDFIKQGNKELRALPREDVSASAEEIIKRLTSEAVRTQHTDRMAPSSPAAYDKSQVRTEPPPQSLSERLMSVKTYFMSYFGRKGGSSYKYKSRNMRKSRKMRKMRKSRKSCRKGRK